MVKRGSHDTRDRLIDATLDLVAARGFDGVSVGDIEAGAGLAPRSGALYKYFDSKLAVLEAGLERHLGALAEIEDDLVGPVDDPLALADVVVRWLLEELDRERTVTAVMEREGDRLPELRDRMREGVSERGYRVASTVVARLAPAATDAAVDHDALAVLLVGSIVNLRRSTWTFGAAPLGVDDDRFVATFVGLCAALLGLTADR